MVFSNDCSFHCLYVTTMPCTCILTCIPCIYQSNDDIENLHVQYVVISEDT